MAIIDTHAHIYDRSVYKDIDSLLNDLNKFGVNKVLLPSTTLADDEYIKGLVSVNSELFYPMVGIHPDYIDCYYKEKVKLVEKCLSNYNYVAIGEVGLDYYNNSTNRDEQRCFFDLILDVAISANLPVSIHCRDAFDDTYKILKSKRNLKGVIHCFTGSLTEAEKYIDIGFYLGIGGILTFRNSKLRDVLSKISLKHLVLETDSPFLSPEPVRGSVNTPCNLIYVIECLSKVYNVEKNVIEERTSENARNIFKIS